MDAITKKLLKEVANLDAIPHGAYNLRVNGKSISRNSTAEIEIESKKDKPGINIRIKGTTKNKSVHIPVILSQAKMTDVVYNDFFVEENANVTIIAGCGIYNCSNFTSEHDGIHTFYLGKNSKVKYIEKHLGLGTANNKKNLNPTTKVFMEEGSQMEMETTQIGGVSTAYRETIAQLGNNSKLKITEKILTTDTETAKTNFSVELKGENSSVEVISKSVAKDNSKQTFQSTLVGKNKSFGYVKCDGIIVGNGEITSIPKIQAKNINSTLIHEAAIGKIAGDALIKLETLGLTPKQAEEEIISGFLN